MYEGLTFSHVKFYHDLSAGLKNLPRKPQNFGDNWPLASNFNGFHPKWLILFTTFQPAVLYANGLQSETLGI